MRSVIKLLVVVVSAVLLSAAAASAAVPQAVSYQGYLQSTSGTPVNGTVSMTFGLYTAPAGTAAPLWTETQSVVNVTSGVYSAQLGSVSPLNLPFDQQYWLGITVGGDLEMTPRQALASVPYAIRSGCNPGDYFGCYTGAPGTRDKGVCKGGVRTCRPDGAGFGACEGEIVPSAEVCYNQVDEDCDGVLDTGCAPRACTPDTTIPCYDGPQGTQAIGGCQAGVQTCNAEGSAYGPCVGQVLPSSEVCDSLDNNCNGQTDEAFNTATDPDNCGFCNQVCSSQNMATRTCTSGNCSGSCNSGFADCNGDRRTDGCETNINTSVNDCGSCGSVCSSSNIARSCTAGACTGVCNAGSGGR